MKFGLGFVGTLTTPKLQRYITASYYFFYYYYTHFGNFSGTGCTTGKLGSKMTGI